MPYNGVGTFTSLGAPTFPAVPNTYILASYFNATMNDIFTGLSSVMTRDGQAAATANWSMGGFKLTNVGSGSAATDAVNYGQVFSSPTIANPTFTGTVTIPTPAGGDASTAAANTSWVDTWFAKKASPTFTGTPVAPTAAPGTQTTQLATTEFVNLSYAPLASPALTGTPTAPTPAASDNTTKIATTAWVTSFAFSLTIPDNVDYAGFMAVYSAFGGINSGNA